MTRPPTTKAQELAADALTAIEEGDALALALYLQHAANHPAGADRRVLEVVAKALAKGGDRWDLVFKKAPHRPRLDLADWYTKWDIGREVVSRIEAAKAKARSTDAPLKSIEDSIKRAYCKETGCTERAARTAVEIYRASRR